MIIKSILECMNLNSKTHIFFRKDVFYIQMLVMHYVPVNNVLQYLGVHLDNSIAKLTVRLLL